MNPENESGRPPTLTRFLCQELLYEFVSGHLDLDKQKAVDEHLNGCRESQRELERLKKGLRYTTQATQIQVSDELLLALQEFEPQWKKTVASWTLHSSQRGWKMLPYIFVVVAIALGVLVWKPWNQNARNDELLAQKVKTEAEAPAPTAVAASAPAANSEEKPEAEAEAPAPQATLPGIVPDLAAKPAATTPSIAVADEEDKPAESEGWVSRGKIEVEDFDQAWPSIRDKILALGGKAAGAAELGVQRHAGVAEFNFSLPESNQTEFDSFLKTFGPVRIVKERHPRVMPEGQNHIILSVKGGQPDESSTETP